MTTSMTLFANGGAVANPLKGKFNLSAVMETQGGHNRISLKGARFRQIVAGKEIAVRDEPYLDIMLVGISDHVQRTFYKGKYDPTVKTGPTCFSLDGQKPDTRASEPQCTSCAACPQNVKGSKTNDSNGKKSIACSFSRKLIIALPGEADENLYELNVNSISYFGDGLKAESKYPFKAYHEHLRGYKTDLGDIVHRISFDMESSVPKIYFSPLRNHTEAEAQRALALIGSDEVKDLLSGDLDFSTETSAVSEPAAPAVQAFEETPVSAPAAKPQQAEAPKGQGRPKKEATPAPQPTPAPVQKAEIITDDEDDAELADLIAGFE